MNSAFIDKTCDSVFFGTPSEFKTSFPLLNADAFSSVITRELSASDEKDVFKRLPSFNELKSVDLADVDYVIYAKEGVICEDFVTLRLKDSKYHNFLVVADKLSQFKLNIDNQGVESSTFTFVLALSEQSNVEFIQQNNSCNGVRNFVYVDQKENSVFKCFSVFYDAKDVKNYTKNSLNTPNIESHFYGVSLVDSDETVENNVLVGHFKEQCNSTQHYKAVVAEGGKSVFNGRIYVAKDAQLTEAFQQCNNILLGDGAKVKNLPQLEIYADDVKCSHGATIGELDAEAIYYMRQRGISAAEAKKLQIGGFVSNIINKISSSELSEQIIARIEDKLGSL